MNHDTPQSGEVDRFILEEIDTVPHLEALLLVWASRPRRWTVDEMAAGLYLPAGDARGILQNLTRRRLLSAEPAGAETYGMAGNREELIGAVESAYRRELIRITRMIHSKATQGVRDFADAFRFTKDKG